MGVGGRIRLRRTSRRSSRTGRRGRTTTRVPPLSPEAGPRSPASAPETYTRLLPDRSDRRSPRAYAEGRPPRARRFGFRSLTLDHPDGVDGSNVRINTTAADPADECRPPRQTLGVRPLRASGRRADGRDRVVRAAEAFQRWAGCQGRAARGGYRPSRRPCLEDSSISRTQPYRDAVRYAEEVGAADHRALRPPSAVSMASPSPRNSGADLAAPEPHRRTFLTGQDAGMPGIVRPLWQACPLRKGLGPSSHPRIGGRCERRVPSEPAPGALRVRGSSSTGQALPSNGAACQLDH